MMCPSPFPSTTIICVHHLVPEIILYLYKIQVLKYIVQYLSNCAPLEVLLMLT